MCLLQEGLDVLGGGVVFFGEVQGADGGFEVFSVELALRLSDETREGVGVQSERLGAVGSRFLFVDLVRVLVTIDRIALLHKDSYLCVAFASHLD